MRHAKLGDATDLSRSVLRPLRHVADIGQRATRPRRRPAGTTLIELAVVLTLIGILAAFAVPALHRRRDRAAVRQAVQLLTDALAVARDAALAGAAPVAVGLGEPGATITVHSAADTIERHALGALLGVTLRTTRDSMAYGPDGLGIGAANLTVILDRGSASDTLVVSRLGRVR
ncbi:MAG: GspH/FimT family pseudopilin [Gemmatimonadaceae bacterium]